MDILFALIAFGFMYGFLSTIRAYIHKEKGTALAIVTSLLFACLFWIVIYALAA